MAKRWKVASGGKIKHKRVTFAPTDLVDTYAALAAQFMSAIFELEPGEYLITDESDVLDFTPVDESDTSEIWHRIEATYGISQSDADSGRLAAIFEAIANRQRIQ